MSLKSNILFSVVVCLLIWIICILMFDLGYGPSKTHNSYDWESFKRAADYIDSVNAEKIVHIQELTERQNQSISDIVDQIKVATDTIEILNLKLKGANEARLFYQEKCSFYSEVLSSYATMFHTESKKLERYGR